MQDVGNNLMITGIVWQVVTLIVFALLVGDYARRASARRSILPASAITLLGTMRFKLFAGGLILAFLTIFTRCVYRIAEMVGGWQNEIMQNETDFIVLEGVMIVIATLCLTVFHPGIVFPEMQQHGLKNLSGEVQAEKVADGDSTSDSTMHVNRGGNFSTV